MFIWKVLPNQVASEPSLAEAADQHHVTVRSVKTPHTKRHRAPWCRGYLTSRGAPVVRSGASRRCRLLRRRTSGRRLPQSPAHLSSLYLTFLPFLSERGSFVCFEEVASCIGWTYSSTPLRERASDRVRVALICWCSRSMELRCPGTAFTDLFVCHQG